MLTRTCESCCRRLDTCTDDHKYRLDGYTYLCPECIAHFDTEDLLLDSEIQDVLKPQYHDTIIADFLRNL